MNGHCMMIYNLTYFSHCLRFLKYRPGKLGKPETAKFLVSLYIDLSFGRFLGDLGFLRELFFLCVKPATLKERCKTHVKTGFHYT